MNDKNSAFPYDSINICAGSTYQKRITLGY